MKINTIILSICLFSASLNSCTSDNKVAEKATPEEAKSFTDKLNTFVDSVKIYNERWGKTYQDLVKNKSADFTSLKNVRSEYRTFIDHSIESLNKMKDVGQYSRELRASFLELLTVQKTNIDKYLIKFEEIEHADSTKIKAIFQQIESEGFAGQLAERDALIKVNQFKKLYQKENNIESPKQVSNTAPVDSIKK